MIQVTANVDEIIFRGIVLLIQLLLRLPDKPASCQSPTLNRELFPRARHSAPSTDNSCLSLWCINSSTQPMSTQQTQFRFLHLREKTNMAGEERKTGFHLRLVSSCSSPESRYTASPLSIHRPHTATHAAAAAEAGLFVGR